MFKKRAFLAVIVSIIVVGSTTFGILMYLDRRDYRIFMQNQFQRNLYDIISDVENIQVSLSKVAIASTEKDTLVMFSEVWKDATDAQDKINTLPVTHNALSKTSKFLSQVGDFSYSLLKENNSGKKLNKAQLDSLEKLRNYSVNLNSQLNTLQNSLNIKTIDWGEIKNKGRNLFLRSAQNPVDLKFERIATDIQQYPTLIYDGPFSENALNIKPRVISEGEISVNEAKRVVTRMLNGKSIEGISLYDNKNTGRIPVYSFYVKPKNQKDRNINIDISKNGGHPVLLLDSKNIGAARIKPSDAIVKGNKYLESLGYKDMIPTFSLRYDNVLVINYVYVKDRVVVYPDQIKLKVALDNGDIVGIEGMHYLIAHYNRNINKKILSPENARVKVNKNLKIKNTRLCIIPMEGQREVMCYEFMGDYNSERFLVYINAINGSEERVLKILKTPNGELTM